MSIFLFTEANFKSHAPLGFTAIDSPLVSKAKPLKAIAPPASLADTPYRLS